MYASDVEVRDRMNLFIRNFCGIPESELYLHADYVTKGMWDRCQSEGLDDIWQQFFEDSLKGLENISKESLAYILNETSFANIYFLYKMSDKPVPVYVKNALVEFRNNKLKHQNVCNIS